MILDLLTYTEGFFKDYLPRYNRSYHSIEGIRGSRTEDSNLILVKVKILNDKYDDSEIPHKNSKYKYELFYIPYNVLGSIYETLKWLNEDLYIKNFYFCT